MHKYKLEGTSFDAILLAAIRMLTTLLGIVSTMLLSKSLSLAEYGTYSQANLVISVGTSMSILGLTDGVNYFFNRPVDEETKKKYISTIFFLQCVIGSGLGIGILVFQDLLVQYFQNKQLASFFLYIAFRPLLSNFIAMLQVLQVSIGQAKTIAYRNVVLSIVKLISIIIAVKILDDIRSIFLILFILDVITVLFFGMSFAKKKFSIRINQFSKAMIPEIRRFCVPMGIFVLTNSLSRDIDKIVIARMGGIDELAIYTNCATLLPVDIISSAFFTMIVPIMTRYVTKNDWKHGCQLFAAYLQQGYLTTVTFSAAIVMLSREIILFLYGEPYLMGQPVFILYMIVDMLRFVNLSLILSANGETPLLMKISIVSLGANAVLNMVFYQIFGFVGPAVATVVISVATTGTLFAHSLKILHAKTSDVIQFSQFFSFILEVLACAAVFRWIGTQLEQFGVQEFLVLAVSGGGMCGTVLLINRKTMISLLKRMNQMK